MKWFINDGNQLTLFFVTWYTHTYLILERDVVWSGEGARGVVRGGGGVECTEWELQLTNGLCKFPLKLVQHVHQKALTSSVYWTIHAAMCILGRKGLMGCLERGGGKNAVDNKSIYFISICINKLLQMFSYVVKTSI